MNPIRFAAALLACAVVANGQTPALSTAPSVESKAGVPVFSVAPSDTLTGANRAAVEELITATLGVIESADFAARFDSLQATYPVLWSSDRSGRLTPAEVAQIYLGRHGTLVAAPTVVMVNSSYDLPAAGFYRGLPPRGVITLTPTVLDRWRDNRLERKSCAVNTMAHELTHIIPRGGKRPRPLFTDAGRDRATRLGRPLVSYTVGTLAQCTMLQRQGSIGEGGFPACMEKWGTSEFNSDYCGDPPASHH